MKQLTGTSNRVVNVVLSIEFIAAITCFALLAYNLAANGL